MAKRENKEDRSKAQLEAFVEAARALECDESEERFDEALKKVARHKPIEEGVGARPAPRSEASQEPK